MKSEDGTLGHQIGQTSNKPKQFGKKLKKIKVISYVWLCGLCLELHMRLE